MKLRILQLTVFAIVSGVSVSSIAHAQQSTVLPCARGGKCVVGVSGPGGGRIVYVAATPQWWGTYIEARPLIKTRGLPWSLHPRESLYSSANGDIERQRIDARGLGMGAINTQNIVDHDGQGRYAAKKALDLWAGHKGDWFLPSRDELDEVYHLASISTWTGMYKQAYWSSSENSDKFAWYQMFQDGTQYTDEHHIGKVDGVPVTSNKDRTANARHGGSGFISAPYRIVVVRYFGAKAGVRVQSPTPVLTGRTCSAESGCALGDYGPGGGVVFYDAGTHEQWGRYLEMAPSSTEVSGLPWKNLAINDTKIILYTGNSRLLPRLQRIAAKRMGMGAINTRLIVRKFGVAQYAAKYASDLVVNGFDDWFLPSEDELNELYEFEHVGTKPLDGTTNSYYWSSSEYDFHNAWTVLFNDGQQFDREKYNVQTLTVKPLRTRAIRAFG